MLTGREDPSSPLAAQHAVMYCSNKKCLPSVHGNQQVPFKVVDVVKANCIYLMSSKQETSINVFFLSGNWHHHTIIQQHEVYQCSRSNQFLYWVLGKNPCRNILDGFQVSEAAVERDQIKDKCINKRVSTHPVQLWIGAVELSSNPLLLEDLLHNLLIKT